MGGAPRRERSHSLMVAENLDLTAVGSVVYPPSGVSTWSSCRRGVWRSRRRKGALEPVSKPYSARAERSSIRVWM